MNVPVFITLGPLRELAGIFIFDIICPHSSVLTDIKVKLLHTHTLLRTGGFLGFLQLIAAFIMMIFNLCFISIVA